MLKGLPSGISMTVYLAVEILKDFLLDKCVILVDA